jgi:uncharacterized protein YijF (DUF1287 family)
MMEVMRALLLCCCLAATASADVRDRGIFPDLDSQVPIESPIPAADDRPLSVRIDEKRAMATVYFGDEPVAIVHHPFASDVASRLDTAHVEHGAPPSSEDRDGDGIVDRLDILRGEKKLLKNGAAYHERYVGLPYPDGDVPRTEGVCSDTVIRALRNAGIDLQREVHEDILMAPRAYPMVEKIDASINHRRVKTLLPWFRRHAQRITSGDYRPGDVLFFDTFPTKSGPEHIGLVSDRRGPDGKYLIVNNWTDGAVDAEMPLLSFVPVTDHFRVASAARRASSR